MKKEKSPEGKSKYLEELFGEENEERTPKPKKKKLESSSKERVAEKPSEKGASEDKGKETAAKEAEKPVASVKTELELKRLRMLKHLKAFDEEKVDATLEKSDLRRKKVRRKFSGIPFDAHCNIFPISEQEDGNDP